MDEQKPANPGNLGVEKPLGEPEPVFFNVMPKSAGQGSFTEPKIKVEITSPQPSSKQSKFFDAVKKYKWYIIGVVGLVAIGFAVYFIAGKIGSSGITSENLVVEHHQGSAPQVKSQTASSTPASPFTTPQAWRDKYWSNCTDVTQCGDIADPDNDGLTNLEEYQQKTDPNNADSDQDGLSDGDEVNIFGSDPLNAHTGKDPKFTDADFLKGGFDIQTNKKMTPDQILSLSTKMKKFVLHQPTLTTLGQSLATLYGFPSSIPVPIASSTPVQTATSSLPTGLDESIDAKETRDTKRSETIQNIEVALVKYQGDNKAYPLTNDFNVMYSDVKLYLKVATNPLDPVNKDPYVYSYTSDTNGTDFTLSFYSEVAGQIIKRNAANAIKDAGNEEAAVYDNQRQSDLESIRLALLLYSQNNVAGNQDYVFPTKDKYKTAIVPDYIPQIPKDPKTGADYDYEVSTTFDTFTLKAPLDNPPVGSTGYLCNQDGCQNY
jgi:hypothetical protein